MLHFTNFPSLTSLMTLTIKEIGRFSRIWVQTLLPSVVNMLLHFIVFGRVLGEHIKMVHDFQYMTYITPGLIMMSVVVNSFQNVSASLYSMRFQRSIEELLIAPLSNFSLLTGFVLGGVARGLIIGVLVTALALCFTPLPLSHPWVLLAIVPTTALLFSLAGFLNALFARNFDDISIIPTFVLTPLTYLGGIFYPITALPPFWQAVSLCNPLMYIVNAFRYAILGISDVPVGYALVMVWFFCVVFVMLNSYLLKLGTGLRK